MSEHACIESVPDLEFQRQLAAQRLASVVVSPQRSSGSGSQHSSICKTTQQQEILDLEHLKCELEKLSGAKNSCILKQVSEERRTSKIVKQDSLEKESELSTFPLVRVAVGSHQQSTSVPSLSTRIETIGMVQSCNRIYRINNLRLEALLPLDALKRIQAMKAVMNSVHDRRKESLAMHLAKQLPN